MFSVFYRTARDEALRVLVLVDGHPVRLAALRAFYRGRHDVLDALWWRIHPLESSPRGIADPASERDALQRRAYSRQGESSPVVDHHDPATDTDIHLTADELRLRHVDLALEADARALDDAIADFLAEFATGAAAILGAGTPMEAAGEPMADRRRPFWLTAVAVVIALVMVVATAALWWRLQDVSDRLEAATGDPASEMVDPVEDWRDLNITVGALLIFRNAQTLDDVYPLQLPVAYDIRAVRQLVPYDQGDGFRLFGVLAQPDQICLVIVFSDLSSSSSCVGDSEFAKAGITLTTNAVLVRRTETDPAHYVSNRITWNPDGSIVSSAGPA